MARTNFRTVGQLLTGTSTTVVYTCPSHYDAIIRTLHINNLHSSAVDLTIKAVLSSTDLPIVTTHSMATDTLLDVLNSNPIALNAADTIVVTAGTANKLNVVVTVEELFTGV